MACIFAGGVLVIEFLYKVHHGSKTRAMGWESWSIDLL